MRAHLLPNLLCGSAPVRLQQPEHQHLLSPLAPRLRMPPKPEDVAQGGRRQP